MKKMSVGLGAVCAVLMTVSAEEIVFSHTGEPLEVIASEDAFYPPMPNETSGTYGNSRLLIANRRLSDYRIAATKVRIGRNNGATYDSPAYHLVKDGDSWEFQSMAKNDVWIKGVKVRIYQDGNDIRLQTIWARYAQGGLGVGVDMNVNYTGEVTVLSCNNSIDGNANYGLYSITLKKELSPADAQVLGNRAIGADDTVKIGEDVLLKVDATTPAEDPFGGAPVSLADLSGLIVTDRAQTSLGSTFAGSGNTIDLIGAVGEETDCTFTTGGKKIVNTTAVSLANDVRLEDIVDVVSCDIYQNSLMKSGITPGEPPASPAAEDAGIFHIERTPTNLIFQVQYLSSDNWNKASLVEIYPSGEGVAVRVLKSYWQRWQSGAAPLGCDYRTTKVEGTSACSYPISNLVVSAKSRVNVNLTGNLTALKETTMTMRGRQNVNLLSTTALPGGCLVVGEGTDVRLKANVNTVAPLDVRVGAGGVLRVYKNTSGSGFTPGANIRDNFTVDGGELALSPTKVGDASNYGDAGYYGDTLKLLNGGRVTGGRPRVHAGSAVWTADGVGTCRIDGGAILVNSAKDYASGKTFVLDVAGGAELATAGAFDDFTQGQGYLSGTRILKKGGGSWRVEAASQLFGFVEVRDGELVYGMADPFPKSGGVILSGGALSVSEGLSVAPVTFNVTATTELKLASGATLSLPSPADADYALHLESGKTQEYQKRFSLADGVRVNVTLADGTAAVRVGTSKCLSAAQCRAFRINGKRVAQNDDGTLVAVEGGYIYLR